MASTSLSRIMKAPQSSARDPTHHQVWNFCASTPSVWVLWAPQTHAETQASTDPSWTRSNPKRILKRNCLWIFRFMSLQGAPFEINLIKQVVLLISSNYSCKSQALRPVVKWNLIWSQAQPGSVSPVGICRNVPSPISVLLSRCSNLLKTVMRID